MKIFMYLVCVASAGCAAPRVITQMTFAGDQAKFIYNGGQHGLIHCDVADDGALDACRKLDVVFEKRER